MAQAYGIVEAVDEAGIAQTIGMQTIGRISKRLEHTPTSLHDVEGIANEGMREGIRSVVLMVAVGPVIYIVIRGSGKVLLKRNGQYANLLEQEGSISGQVQIGDVFILTSGGCNQLLEERDVLALLENTKSTEASERIAMMVNNKADSAGCAAIVLEIDAFVTSNTNPPQTIASKVGSVVRSYSDPVKIKRFVHANPREKVLTVKRHLLLWRHRMKNPKISITVILLFCFGVSVLVGIQRELSTKKDTRLTGMMVEAQRMYEEGTALMELNPVKGRERLTAAQTTMESVQSSLNTKTKEGRRGLELYQQIHDAVIQAMRAYKQEPQVFYDAGLLKSDGTATTMAVEGNTVLIGDNKEKALYTVTLPAKTGAIVGGGSGYETVQSVALHGSTGYALLADGISSIDLNQKTTKQNSIKRADEWGTITAMVSFGGNMYLLDTTKSRIWKYVATENGFSELREYLNPDTLPDLSKATSIAIDGSVWIGTNDGRIMKFTQGKEGTFSPKGIDPKLGLHLIVYTSDELNNVYVLDSDQQRVVVLDKDGMYLSQYVWEKATPFSHLVVSEKHGKILLLGNDAVYSIDIQ